MNKNIFNFSIIALFLFSCSPTIKDFDKFKTQPLKMDKYLPGKESLKKNKIVVAILDFDTTNSPIANNLGLGNIISSKIENVLVKNRNIQILDRKIANKLKGYIKDGNLKTIPNDVLGNISLDYIITGSFDKAETSKRYLNKLASNVIGGILINTTNCGNSKSCETGRNIGNAMNVADAVVNPGYWIYNGEVAGNIKIYDASNMLLIESITFNGSSEMVEDVSLLANNNGKNGNISAIIKHALDNSLITFKNRLHNIFIYNGYILEKRAYDGKTIFRINLGSNDGLAMGDKFKVYSIENNYNPITDENTPEEIEIGTGVVSNIISHNNAWVIIDDKKTTDKIRLGNIVKIKK